MVVRAAQKIKAFRKWQYTRQDRDKCVKSGNSDNTNEK
jgi:hypothetical protein